MSKYASLGLPLLLCSIGSSCKTQEHHLAVTTADTRAPRVMIAKQE
jgi:hypothetical protein